jgi:hypothetical protein
MKFIFGIFRKIVIVVELGETFIVKTYKPKTSYNII